MIVSQLVREVWISRNDICVRLLYLPEMQNFFDGSCKTQEEYIRRKYTEITLKKKNAVEKEFTYDDRKRKVLIRGSL